jgi:hypothetical protein
MKDPTRRDPKNLVIKVTDTDDHCFFIHFDRASQTVVKVDEYRTTYRPWMTNCPLRTKAAISAARTKLDIAPEETETLGETK